MVWISPPVSSQLCTPGSRWATILPTSTGDQLAIAVAMLSFLHQVALGPEATPDAVAEALDAVAIDCAPRRDISINPAKMLAICLADANPLVWGGSVLAARAARRVAESIRRTSGRTALAGDAEHLLPVIEAARPRTVFDDPFADFDGEASDLRPVLVVMDDGVEEPMILEQRSRLAEAAGSHGVRLQTVSTDAHGEVDRYASLLLHGTYAAEYLRLGLVAD